MAADLNDLRPDARSLMEELLQRCKARGVEMRPNETLRDPLQQARYWRRSRTSQEIAAKVKQLEKAGAGFLAACLDVVGPQHGAHVTNALPGLSWHQWGEALDCFWVVKNKAVWDVDLTVNGINGFRLYAETAQKLGLTAGGFWKFKDWPHVQLRAAAGPQSQFSLTEIDGVMRERFGHLLVKEVPPVDSLLGQPVA